MSELYRKASKSENYIITEEEFLSFLIENDSFLFAPVFWDEADLNHSLLEKFERDNYIIRADKTPLACGYNDAYVYYVKERIKE